MAMTRIDRRARRTRAMLHEALMSLIAEKGYDPITVNDICERADVGRSTFYAHFAGKDDLMRSGLNQLRNIAFDRQTDEPEIAFSLMMLEHARDHFHLHEKLGNRGRCIVDDTVHQILSDLVRGELAASASEKSNGAVPRELIVQYIVGGYMAVVTWWLDGGTKLPPQRVNAMFRRLATECIAPLHDQDSRH